MFEELKLTDEELGQQMFLCTNRSMFMSDARLIADAATRKCLEALKAKGRHTNCMPVKPTKVMKTASEDPPPEWIFVYGQSGTLTFIPDES